MRGTGAGEGLLVPVQAVRALLDPHSDRTVGQELALDEQVTAGPVSLVAHTVHHHTVVADC